MRGAALFAIAAVTVAGCSRLAAPATGPESGTYGDAPKFEAELAHTLSSGGSGTCALTHVAQTVTINGQVTHVRLRAVESVTLGLSAGKATLTVKVDFAGHRDGKDRYKFTYVVEAPDGATVSSSEVSYDGLRQVLVEDRYASVAICPPSKVPE